MGSSLRFETMRLKTKLVLAITGLVFLIAGLLSLVYVSHLVDAAIQQSDDSNRMIANQVRFALQNALQAGLKDQTVDPNDKKKLRELVEAAIQDSESLRATLDSANRYSADRVRREYRGYAVARPVKHVSEK